MKEDEQNKKPNNWSWKKSLAWGTIVLVVAIVIPASPLLFESYDAIIGWVPQTQNSIDPEKAGQFGDFVGGFIGTIAFIVSVFVLLISYLNQKETNQKMLSDQEKLHGRTSFESRFFELLHYHRENLKAIQITSLLPDTDADEKVGVRVFVSLIREFRQTLDIVRETVLFCGSNIDYLGKIDLAYKALYYGVGPNSTRVLISDLNRYPEKLGKIISQVMRTEQGYFTDRKLGVEELEPEVSQIAKIRIGRLKKLKPHYVPFDGHQSRLGHYYRHLWQMMKYVDTHAPEGTAQEYADIVRAQLSNHEQALLCLNSLSSIGAAWKKNDGEDGLLVRYSLIKNIPNGFFDSKTELDLKATFPTITFEFETNSYSVAGPNRDVSAPAKDDVNALGD